MPMPELSASQDQTKDTAFPPTPFKINKMWDLKYDSCNSELPKISIMA